MGNNNITKSPPPQNRFLPTSAHTDGCSPGLVRAWRRENNHQQPHMEANLPTSRPRTDRSSEWGESCWGTELRMTAPPWIPRAAAATSPERAAAARAVAETRCRSSGTKPTIPGVDSDESARCAEQLRWPDSRIPAAPPAATFPQIGRKIRERISARKGPCSRTAGWVPLPSWWAVLNNTLTERHRCWAHFHIVWQPVQSVRTGEGQKQPATVGHVSSSSANPRNVFPSLQAAIHLSLT